MKSYTLAMLLGLVLGLGAQAQQFKPGDAIEYLSHGSYPPKWERGVFVSELPGGKQYAIREKPTQFFPEGSQIAYGVNEVRRPGAGAPAVELRRPRSPQLPLPHRHRRRAPICPAADCSPRKRSSPMRGR